MSQVRLSYEEAIAYMVEGGIIECPSVRRRRLYRGVWEASDAYNNSWGPWHSYSIDSLNTADFNYIKVNSGST